MAYNFDTSQTPRRTTSAHLRKRAHISKVPISIFVCHNSARAENCKTYTFHDHEHKFKRAEKSALFKIQVYIYIYVCVCACVYVYA